MVATLYVPFRFNGSHSLPSRPRLHSHAFEVTLALRGPIDEQTGMIVDILKVQPVVSALAAKLEGRSINELALLEEAPAPMKLAAKFPTC
jgi:6-pyruvoyltetrahydropterin/6-carboxytetrahydropterin synthase